MEIWKKIEGFENYSISNFGNVINNKTNKIMSKTKDKNGYLVVNIRNSNGKKLKKIHRLVAIAFIKNSLNKETVNHLNGIKTDNNLKNLEWATRKEQAIHKVKIGLHNNLKIKVYCTKSNLFFNSIVDASKYFNLNASTLTAKLNGTRKNNTSIKYVGK